MAKFGKGSGDDTKVIPNPSVEKQGPFPDVMGGAQGVRTDGNVRSGAPEAGSKFSPAQKRGYGAARKG